jgi:hypothetical protein
LSTSRRKFGESGQSASKITELRFPGDNADPPHPLALLGAHTDRPRDCRAAEQR